MRTGIQIRPIGEVAVMRRGSVLILGARSDIGMAVARRFAQSGRPVQLAARNVSSLEPDRADIELRHRVDATLHEFDVVAIENHAAFIDGLPELPQVAVCAVGLLGNQQECERNIASALQVMRANYEGPVCILSELATRFETRGSGTLVGISSVAGERGRGTNYIYGAAKAGLTAYLSGLRNRLARKGVDVVTVLPGFVVTKMTEGMDLPRWLTVQPKFVALRIEQAVRQRRSIIYVGPIWRPMMAIIKVIPEFIFKRLKL